MLTLVSLHRCLVASGGSLSVAARIDRDFCIKIGDIMQHADTDNIANLDQRRRSKPIDRQSKPVKLRVIDEFQRPDGRWVTRCEIVQRSADVVPLKV